MGCGVAMTILENRQNIELEAKTHHSKSKECQIVSSIQKMKIKSPHLNQQKNIQSVKPKNTQDSEHLPCTKTVSIFSQEKPVNRQQHKEIKKEPIISLGTQQVKNQKIKHQSDANLFPENNLIVNKQISKETMIDTNFPVQTSKQDSVTNQRLQETSILSGVKENTKNQREDNKRQSTKIQQIINNNKQSQNISIQQKKGKIIASNRSLKNQISRKDLKIKKQMVPVDSLFLQTTQQPLIQKQNNVLQNKQQINSKPPDINTRNVPPSRKGVKNQPIAIVENLKEIDKNLETHQLNGNKITVQKLNSKKQLLKKQQILQNKTLLGDRLGSKQSNNERNKLDGKKKAEQEKKKIEQKRIQEAKKQLDKKEKQAIKIETDKMKKLYNL